MVEAVDPGQLLVDEVDLPVDPLDLGTDCLLVWERPEPILAPLDLGGETFKAFLSAYLVHLAPRPPSGPVVIELERFTRTGEVVEFSPGRRGGDHFLDRVGHDSKLLGDPPAIKSWRHDRRCQRIRPFLDRGRNGATTANVPEIKAAPMRTGA